MTGLRFFLLCFLGVIGASLAFWAGRNAETSPTSSFTIGLLPDQDKALLEKSFAPVLEYLNQETGFEFLLKIPEDYGSLVALFAARDVDLAYFGGMTFVQAQHRAQAQPLVMRAADTKFTSVFIARDEFPWRNCLRLTCDDLVSATFSFGSELSTSGHLMPRFHLKSQLGLEAEPSFGAVLYSGSHDMTAHLVRSGTADIGAMNSAIYRAMYRDGRLAPGELIELWETPPFPDYVWAVQPGLSPAVKTKLRDAFLALNHRDPRDISALTSLDATYFIPASVRDFAPLIAIAQSSGLLEDK